MSIGVIVNTSAVLVGTVIGAYLAHYIPSHLKESLPKIFGVCSIVIGINSAVGVQTLPMVIMAVICGSVIGELFHLDQYVERGYRFVLSKLHFSIDGDIDDYMETYILVVLTFSMSGMGIFRALSEGMSGDATILISKSVLDFFTAVLFGTTLGYAQSLICIPQFIILSLCALSAQLILPLVSTTMIVDFKACGGVIIMITGHTVARIMKVKAINLVPALIIVMPLIAFYTQFL